MDIKKYIFELNKDKAVTRKVFVEQTTKKYNIKENDAIDIYNDIVNHQIKKYGNQLYGKMYEDTLQKKRRNLAHQARKYRRKNDY